MANNPYVNKVVKADGTTIIDISDTTALAADVISGKYFYLATGEKIEGTASGGGGVPTYETYFDDSISVGEYGIYIASLADLYFADGETWRVTWDGVEYICNPELYEGWLWTVGNQSLAGTDDGINEPFVLYNYGGGAMNGNTRTAGTHTLKLEKQTSSGGGSSSDNPLSGKILAVTGDSIAYGTGYTGGYAGIIGTEQGMTVQNIAVGGGTIVNSGSNVFCISESISNLRSDADFILLEGGGNDSDSNITLGTLTAGYNDTLDTTTFAGAFENMLKSAIARFPNKKIGYILIHKCAWQFDSRVPNSYYDMVINACKKWGIPYLDLNTQVPPLGYIADLKTTYTANADGYHPNELGYRTFYVPKIVAFLKTMLTDNSLIAKTVTTNGTYLASDDDADGYSSVTVNVPSGASNVVTGTFKGTTTGAAMDVTLNYSGSGYPIAVMIFPSTTSESTFNSTVQRYAVRDYMLDKYTKSSSPTYSESGTENYALALVKYKSSTSNSRSYSNGGSTGVNGVLFANENADNSILNIVKIRSKTKISVFIASSSYGFMANIEYTYVVLYSS